MRSRFWADYSARELAALDRGSLVAVLPVGAIEQHGPHLPLSVDQAILDGVVAAALPHIPEDCPALFLPTLPVGKSDEHALWPGTLTFSAATLMAMWSEIGDSVARAGVRKLVLLNSHGGQMAAMDIVARDLRIRHGMLAVAASWFGMGLPPGLFSPEEERFGIHAGEMETSVMLALQPQHVNMGQARDFHPWIADLAQSNRHLGLGPGGRIGWQAQDMNPSGACGNAAVATAEKGQRVLDHAGREVARLLVEVWLLPMDVLANKPECPA
jgi:creatinine amidohydrolase